MSEILQKSDKFLENEANLAENTSKCVIFGTNVLKLHTILSILLINLLKQVEILIIYNISE